MIVVVFLWDICFLVIRLSGTVLALARACGALLDATITDIWVSDGAPPEQDMAQNVRRED